LAVLGLYGLVSYTVSARTREIATRLALGASPGLIRGRVMREGLVLTGAGLTIGLAVAAASARLIEGLLYETSSIDVPVTVALIAVMATASLVACYLPARRAMRIAPIAALRAE
jgi:ABC-type antimicrobial peptide transport system permease subunit